MGGTPLAGTAGPYSATGQAVKGSLHAQPQRADQWMNRCTDTDPCSRVIHARLPTSRVTHGHGSVSVHLVGRVVLSCMDGPNRSVWRSVLGEPMIGSASANSD